MHAIPHKSSAGVDWRNINSYPDPDRKKTPLKHWAWEFLRRNPEYRADFTRLCEREREIGPEYENLPARRALGEITTDEWNRLNAELHRDKRYWVSEGASVYPICVYLARRWELQTMIDPYGTSHPIFKQTPCVTIVTERWIGFKDPHPAARAAIVLDYEMPLAVQLRQIERHWRGERAYLMSKGAITPWPQKRAAHDCRHYLNCLRVLDAIEQGSSKAEIGETLFPHADKSSRSKSVANHILSAARLRDLDYRSLPFLDLVWPPSD